MLIETHAHLDFQDYDQDREDVINRANDSGIGMIINVSADLKGSLASERLSRQYPCVYAACGIHPHDAASVTDEAIDLLRDLIRSSKKIIAIGEVGLDFYRDLSPRDEQYRAFLRFLDLSREFDLPLIIHCRENTQTSSDAARLIIESLKERFALPIHGVVHCFSACEDILKEYLDMGMYVSFAGNITYRSAEDLRRSLRATPLDRLLLETDSPFLSPLPFRGRRNEPAYIKYILEAISRISGVDMERIEEITTDNAKRLFRLS